MGTRMIVYECLKCGREKDVPEHLARDGNTCALCGGYLNPVRDWVKTRDKNYKLNQSPPLLQIELEDEHSVPKVFYNGEEITGKVQINFEWITRDSRNLNRMNFNIVHADKRGIIYQEGRRVGDLR